MKIFGIGHKIHQIEQIVSVIVPHYRWRRTDKRNINLHFFNIKLYQRGMINNINVDVLLEFCCDFNLELWPPCFFCSVRAQIFNHEMVALSWNS